MPDLLTIPPARRASLLLRPIGNGGDHVVKDLRTGAFFNLGPIESFLLARLDGERSTEEIRADFEERFGEPLDEEELEDFLDLAREKGFLERERPEFPDDPEGTEAGEDVSETNLETDSVLSALRAWPLPGDPAPAPEPKPKLAPATKKRQSILFWRLKLIDPDRLFNLMEPRLRFLWTRAFFLVSALSILGALLVVCFNRGALASQLPGSLRWQVLVLGWLTLAVVTTAHEFAHGLTCKHFGGEVHDIGFLLLFFMPCFYCDVSDTWLFGEKRKRLWVTLAGCYSDLVIWSVSVFIWRLTLPNSTLNFVAWMALSICGVRTFFNLNPLMKLDGYYFLSDLLEIPNLRRRARGAWTGRVRWLLWGAPKPEPEPRGKLLFGYGAAAWSFSFVFLCLMVAGLARVLGSRGGLMGVGWAAFLGLVSVRRLSRGFEGGEFATMIRTRHKRTVLWVAGLALVPVLLAVVRVEDRASGPFSLRPASRVEVRAPTAAFLREIPRDEGDKVRAGELVVRLEVPELDSKIARKEAERRESQANLRLLKVGSKPEEVAEQRERVERAHAWRNLARTDLGRSRRAMVAELNEILAQIVQGRAEADRALDAFQRDRLLLERRALQAEQFRESEKKWRVAQAMIKQAEARQVAREAEGTLLAETELARREKEFEDARAALRLLEAGARPEEIDAEAARLDRLEEEGKFLEGVRGRLRVVSPIDGVVTTPRFREKTGQYLHEGDLICEVESHSALEAEIALTEQDVARVRPGAKIRLKARALPFEEFNAVVERIAPSAARPAAGNAPTVAHADAAASSGRTELPGTVIVFCRIESPPADLRTGMTGHARIHLGPQPIGAILIDRALRLLRTEFWW